MALVRAMVSAISFPAGEISNRRISIHKDRSHPRDIEEIGSDSSC